MTLSELWEHLQLLPGDTEVVILGTCTMCGTSFTVPATKGCFNLEDGKLEIIPPDVDNHQEI